MGIGGNQQEGCLGLANICPDHRMTLEGRCRHSFSHSPRRGRVQVRGLSLQKDPLEEVMATHSSNLAWRISMDRGAWRATVHGSQSQTQQSMHACLVMSASFLPLLIPKLLMHFSSSVFFFFSCLCCTGLWDLISLTRDRTQTLSSESTEP